MFTSLDHRLVLPFDSYSLQINMLCCFMLNGDCECREIVRGGRYNVGGQFYTVVVKVLRTVHFWVIEDKITLSFQTFHD